MAKVAERSSSEDCGQECSNAKPQALKENHINPPQHPATRGTGFATEVTLVGVTRDDVQSSYP